eukprot:TRINITY_DN3905_c0_g1_i4.p1 TRINITY_DN3905_c0_g1~~TRINITY_DN3905_c0_g1_i4.p1  ORF type:complete len:501 (-),score=85.50 TRINITY_DN3905_c0_g1_i4:21-1403(-)
MPCDAGKIAVFDAKQEQLHFVAGKIAVFDAKQEQLHFVEHPDLRGGDRFVTSVVVGKVVVAIPRSAHVVYVLDMTTTIEVTRLIQRLGLQPSSRKEVSDRACAWLKQGSSSLSEVVHEGLVNEFLDELNLGHVMVRRRAENYLRDLVRTPGGAGGHSGGGAGGGDTVLDIHFFSGPPIPPTTFGTSLFKLAYDEAKTHVPQSQLQLKVVVMQVVEAFAEQYNLSKAGANKMCAQLIEEWHIGDHTADQVAEAAELAWTSAKKFPQDGREFCSIYNDALRGGYAVWPTAVFGRALNKSLDARPSFAAQKARGWPQGPHAPPPHKSTEQDITWRGGGFKDTQEIRDFFSVGREYRIAQPLATAFMKDVAQDFIERAEERGPVNSFVMWKIHYDGTEGCKHVNLLQHSHVPHETEFLNVAFAAFKVIFVHWKTGTKQDPHLIGIEAFSDNHDASEDLPLAPWC